VRPLRLLALLLVLALAGSAGTYVVRRGDTLGGIAARLGVPVRDLASANHLANVNLIREGQVLTVPGVSAPPIGLHRVAAGETLGAIASRYGTSVSAVAQLNGIRDVNRVREGTVLRIGAAVASSVCPVQGWVSFVSVFGDPRGGRKHLGYDVAAPRGTPVVANVSGTVEHHPNPLGGLAYYLHGDDGITYYGAHLQEYLGPDRRVRIGEPIGRVGTTGNAPSDLPHLHFERIVQGTSVDGGGVLRRACWVR
jgi:murein DD-endopeptidase MepM/ murein hydrolase activator NlpD